VCIRNKNLSTPPPLQTVRQPLKENCNFFLLFSFIPIQIFLLESEKKGGEQRLAPCVVMGRSKQYNKASLVELKPSAAYLRLSYTLLKWSSSQSEIGKILEMLFPTF